MHMGQPSESTIRGYLVVLKQPRDILQSDNPRYRGLYRMPPYPPEDYAEDAAMDEYVFGDYRDEDTGLIPTLAAAEQLIAKFRPSPRECEVIYADTGTGHLESASGGRRLRFLGFDLANPGGDFWSIVADFTSAPTFAVFARRLNEYGLFATAEEAETYREAYRSHGLAHHDLPWLVWRVYLVERFER